ncbi:MAG: VanZ family protein [Clostridiaceae bacterium]|nr:VanZ family protein [Clostridiaceae bacterium]
MNELLLIAFECLTVILPFLTIFVILNCIYKRKKILQTKIRFLMLSIFAVYIFAVFYVTGVGTIFDLLRYGIDIKADQINLLPFSQDIDVVAYLLNVLLFLLFGILLPFIWPNMNGLKCTVYSGISISLLIEISQLLNNRRTDIDDLLLNTLGSLIGYLLFMMFAHSTKRTIQPVNYFKYEPAIYILAMFIGHFLMFNEFGLAKILYDF